jgi:uncharacterized membrane protein
MKRFLFFAFSLIIFFFFPRICHAEIIHSFDTNIAAHKNGTMDITEIINYDFGNLEKHGIYRYIPTFAKVGDLYRIYKISNVKILRDDQYEQFTTSQADEQFNIKIGNPDKTISGAHIYKISYSIENGIGSNYSDHDEIYWNITGNGWKIPIEKVNAKVTVDFDAKQTSLLCFTGSLGSKDKICNTDSGLVKTTGILSSGEGLTIVAVYPVNTFPKSVLSKNPPKTIGQIVFDLIIKNYYLIYIFLNIILPIILIYWYLKHKNKKRFGPPAVNFDIPKDEKGNIISPALAGTIDTAKLERDDVVATLFDLAIRKYIKIEELKKLRKLLPDSSDHVITKLKDDAKLSAFEKILFKRLFKNGDEIELSSLKIDFYETYGKIENEIFKNLVEKKYYFKNPKYQKGILITLAVLSMFGFNFILTAVLFFLSIKLNGRTALGDEIDFKIDGLKLFLKSMDRNYKWQAMKFYTVEQMIPYAIALGYIDNFMEALKILKPDYNPSWYGGYSGNFYTSYAVFYAATSGNITTATPSSSGSSGGFSGGGGGGGGGGSW